MNPGDVLIDHQFRKQNGEIQPKYIILLNNISEDNFHIFCLSTSDTKRNCDSGNRCNSNDGYFFVGKIKDIFVEETYLVFDYFICNSEDTVNSWISSGSCDYVGKLDENLVNQIRNCIKRSDVPECYLKLILN